MRTHTHTHVHAQSLLYNEKQKKQQQLYEVNPHVLWRVVETHTKQATRAPRLVSCGVKGSLGGMSTLGTLHPDLQTHLDLTFDAKQAHEQWQQGPLAIIDQTTQQETKQQTKPAKKNKKNKKKKIKYWTDYTGCHYHSKSLLELPGIHHKIHRFDCYTQGMALQQQAQQLEEIEDRVRWFAEECDFVQGFHVLCDVDSGFAGLGAAALTQLQDDYPKQALFTFGANAHRNWDAVQDVYLKRQSEVNRALALAEFSSLSTLYTPLAATKEKLYESSAVFAAAVHSVTVPYRCSRPAYDMMTMASTLVPREHLNVFSLAAALPLRGTLPCLDAVAVPGSFAEHKQQKQQQTKKKKVADPLYYSKTLEALSPCDMSRFCTDVELLQRDKLIAEQVVYRGDAFILPKQQNKVFSSSKRFVTLCEHTMRTRCRFRLMSNISTPLVLPDKFPRLFPSFQPEGKKQEEDAEGEAEKPKEENKAVAKQKATLYARKHKAVASVPVMTELASSYGMHRYFGHVQSRLGRLTSVPRVRSEFQKHTNTELDWAAHLETLQILHDEYKASKI
jgi:hypothetical protein